MKANVTAATLLLCGSIFTSPARTRLRHWSLGSKQRQSSMAEAEESAMESENNVTSNVSSDSDTETEPQEELVPKRGNWNSIVWLWFGFKKSDTNQTTVICKTCRQQVVTSDSNTSNLFYHLKIWHEKQYRDSEKMRQSANVTSKPQSDEKKKTHQTTLILTALPDILNGICPLDICVFIGPAARPTGCPTLKKIFTFFILT